MNISRFFIDRPIFAAVLSIIILAAGLIALPMMPIGEYPDVVPPSVQVTAMYPGANPKEIAETVAQPLEASINGVENMMYMKSVASSNGVVVITVTFRPGTDPGAAQVNVQNRVSQATSQLPEAVIRQGVSTKKQSTSFAVIVHLVSKDGKHDSMYLRNYAVLHIKDEIARLPGVGDVVLFGGGDYAMRIWLDPNKVAARGLTAGDVLSAIREQNVQVSAGQLGAEPLPSGSDFLISINAKGRLASVEEFGAVIIKTGSNGELVRLSDVARIELGAGDYSLRAGLDGKEAAAMPVFLAPGANALEVVDVVKAKMNELSKGFPAGMTYETVYDSTIFVRESIDAVIHTLFEAVLLVVLVVILFLQTWRASVIPLVAVPVSIVGTFAVLYPLGFSINTLSLFGLVLAIGIVVDDAIVVVENVERNIHEGLTPLAAAHQAMKEVSGPIVAIALVLCAVFVPMAFLNGVVGQFYKQFAVTIAISTVISPINSLTLSPALAAILLRGQDAQKDAPTRLIDRLFGWLFRPFNRFFTRSSERYERTVSRTLTRRGAVFAAYAVLLVGAGLVFGKVPGGFIPGQDKMYLISIAKLPEGASLSRTSALVEKMTAAATKIDGVEHAISFHGFNLLSGTNTPNTAAVFVTLKSIHERHGRSAEIISAELNRQLGSFKDGFAVAFMPPPVFGLGQGSGYSLFVEDRGGLGYGAMQSALGAFQGAVSQTPGLFYPVSSYQANVPQLELKVDRNKAKMQGVALTSLFETVQTYLGSAYVNDFNQFGRTYRVFAQADGPYRQRVEDIGKLGTRNAAGEIVPISSMVTVGQTYGPDPVIRYNGYPAFDVIGSADAKTMSSTQAMRKIGELAPNVLPNGMTMEWTDLSFQQATQGNAALLVFPLSVMLVFLVLAAMYESWTLPLAIILIVPMCLLSALLGVWLTGGDNSVFVQVGLVVLMGLACKNAILIVEFARELELQGKETLAAALEACRLRLRPIVMTSIAFIAGTVPLLVGKGAGAEVRVVTGTTVFCGMVGVTLFGLFLTPVFYVALRKLAGTKLTA